jgi:L-histidine N-alpha-methyltransferase
MPGGSKLAIDIHVDEDLASRSDDRDMRRGLTSTPKRLPSKYFYDERGSRLFQRITELPEYYLTRAEHRLLQRDATRIARITRPEALIELGSGSAEKTRLLIEAGLDEGVLRRYVPFDVSRETVQRSAQRLADAYPELSVHVVVGDFDRHLDELPHGGGRLIAFLGSTLGNFPHEQAVRFLEKIRGAMEDDDWFLLGTDLVKDKATLEAAYNDSEGVTAEFNRNILNVINERTDGDFDTDAFEHVAQYNEEESRIESKLRSKRAQSVCLRRLDLQVDFQPGEVLRTEVSCKYTRESLRQLLGEAGLRLERWFTDVDHSFALSLSRRKR